MDSITDEMKDFYGKQITHMSEFQTGTSCPFGPSTIPKHISKTISEVHKEIQNKYYGCHLVISEGLEGTNILDLGCGAGLDCYVLSKLVGEKGHVTGVDMTDEQLEVAMRHIEYHTKLYKYNTPNVEFVKGYLQDLGKVGIRENFYDIVISNCVISLCTDKESVFRETYRVLKEGGELYFSDVYADKELPAHKKNNKTLWGEGLAGAITWSQLKTIAVDIGFESPHLVSSFFMDMEDEIKEMIGGDSRFVSATYRMFKLPDGNHSPGIATYRGGIEHCEDKFTFHHNAVFKTDKLVPVDANLMGILRQSRFREKFSFEIMGQDMQATSTNTSHDPFDLAEDNRPGDTTASCGQ